MKVAVLLAIVVPAVVHAAPDVKVPTPSSDREVATRRPGDPSSSGRDVDGRSPSGPQVDRSSSGPQVDPRSSTGLQLGTPVSSSTPRADDDAPPTARTVATAATIPEAPAVGAPPPLDAIGQARRVAGSGRGFLMDTGLTMPRGAAELSLRSAVPAAGLGTLTGGLTDSTELWVEAALAIDVDGVGMFGAGLKQRIASGPNYSLAVLGGMRRFGDGEDGRMLHLGAAATLSNDDGSLMLSGAALLMWFDDEHALRNYTVGLSYGSGTSRFVVEYGMLASEVGLGFMGARFGRSDIQVELGGIGIKVDDEVLPLPYLGLAARM